MTARRIIRRKALIACLMLTCVPAGAQTQRPPQRPDLADIAAGTYDGEVISDSRGSSRSDVRIMVVRTGPNAIYVSSDYPRLPPFPARLTRAMNTIQKTSGPEVFLLNLSKRPFGLDVTVDGASWSGTKTD